MITLRNAYKTEDGVIFECSSDAYKHERLRALREMLSEEAGLESMTESMTQFIEKHREKIVGILTNDQVTAKGGTDASS